MIISTCLILGLIVTAYIHIMYVYFLLLLFHLRLANNNYVTNFLQSNTYLQQPKLPACCDFCGPSAGSIRKKGPKAGKYLQKR